MKVQASIFLAISCLFQQPVIGATTLNTTVTSEPCTTINLPNGGTACAPKVSQRRNFAPKMIKLGDTINTTSKDAAMRLCHHWGGNYISPNPTYGWDCFKRN